MRKLKSSKVALISLFVLVFSASNVFAQQLNRAEIERQIKESPTLKNLSEDYRTALSSFLTKQLTLTMPLMQRFVEEKKITSASEAERVGFLLMNQIRERSVMTLSKADLHQLGTLNLKLIGSMTKFECAQFIRKQRTDEKQKGREIFSIAATLPFNDFKTYLDLHEKALDNLFSKRSEAQQLSEDELQSAKKSFAAKMQTAAQKSESIRSWLKSEKGFNTEDDTTTCVIGTELYKLIMSDDDGRGVIRSVAFLRGQLL